MSAEADFIGRLRTLATHPAARGLLDDAAVLDLAAGKLVATHDMLVEGVHYLPDADPADVAWRLVATNLSDLAAKGAVPIGVLLGYSLRDADWDAAFIDGLGVALEAFDVGLLGGDTVTGRGARTLGMTALGTTAHAPDRRGARAGDVLWVTGTIGDAGLGLALARAGRIEPVALLDAYRRPRPQLAAGQALAPRVSAMADVSDGLLIDAARIAAASGLAVSIDLAAVPLSPAAIEHAGEDRAARIAAATAGDDYQLLFAAPPAAASTLLTLCQGIGVRITAVGALAEGSGIALHDGDGAVPLPAQLGYEHGPFRPPPSEA